MDGFDDLLVPTRKALENNPFEDPFSKQFSSPDPWASFATQIPAYGDENPYANAFETSSTSTIPSQAVHTEEEPEPEKEEFAPAVISDPLDSAAVTIEESSDEEESSIKAKSPGFKDILPPPFSEIATIRPNQPEELEPYISTPTIHSPAFSNAEPSVSPLSPTPPSQLIRATSESESTLSPSGSGWGQESVGSPLDQHPATLIEQPFASLALGGESTGGWQSSSSISDWGLPNPRQEIEDNAEDSDDDKPILQTRRDETGKLTVTKSSTGLQPVFVISVEDPQKVGDPIRSFTMYTVHTKTTSPMFQKSSFSVLRRYSDFLWLYETLSLNNPGVVVPPVPDKNPFGRFDDQFVKQRRSALEKCIQKIANHPVLGKDGDLKLFLESDGFALEIKHRKAEIAHERGGLMASIGQSIAGPRFHETDEWFDRQRGYLDSLESQLKGLVKAIEVAAKQRAELAVATGEFAQTVADLSASNVGKQLSHSLNGLAEIEKKAQELQSIQSVQDMNTLLSTADEYARLINSVRLAFTSRIRTYHSWQAADSDVRRVKQTHERARAAGRVPSQSLNIIADAERKALDAKHEYNHVTKLVKTEVARFERERVEDFKIALNEFLNGMILRQKELIGAWENYQQILLQKVGKGEREE